MIVNFSCAVIWIWHIFTCGVIELATALECQKQLLVSSISNLDARVSLEIGIRPWYAKIFTIMEK